MKEVAMDGLKWAAEFKKAPLAYGIFKIQIGCTIEDRKVSTDDLIEQIEGMDDMVQSVDIVAFNKL
jgi:translation elongation factor EF-1beta